MDDLDKIYREIPPGDIPWNIVEPPEMLVSLVKSGTIIPCKAIDLGCGLGNYAVWLAEKGFAMTGIDISPTAIGKAAMTSSEKGLKIDFLSADLTKPFTHPETFLFAYDWDVLHHIHPAHRGQYAENISRLVATGGKYLSVCFSDKDAFCGPGKFRTTPIGTHLYFSSEEEIREMFGKHFRVLSIETRLIPGKTGDHLCVVAWMEKPGHPSILNNRFPLGFFPTPLHPLTRLSEKYPGYRLFIKRDDQTGLASGGNKTRKLEYFIRHALDAGCDTLITAGAQQSNHCRQTTAACAVVGLNCHVLLGGTEPPIYEGNLLLTRLLGAKIHFSGEKRKGEDIPAVRSELEKEGKKCFVVPYGGSDGMGALGYTAAVSELKGQLEQRTLKIDYIFFATSSGGTQAGLTLGMHLFGLETELMPVNIDKEEPGSPSLETRVAEIAGNGARLLGLEKEFSPLEIRVLRGYDKAGYGVVTDNERSAIRILASTEGIILDPVYTGRAFHAMLDHLEKKLLNPGSNVLFWHTGGFPANFYYSRDLS